MKKITLFLLLFGIFLVGCNDNKKEEPICEEGVFRCEADEVQKCHENLWITVEKCEESGLVCKLLDKKQAECVKKDPGGNETPDEDSSVVNDESNGGNDSSPVNDDEVNDDNPQNSDEDGEDDGSDKDSSGTEDSDLPVDDADDQDPGFSDEDTDDINDEDSDEPQLPCGGCNEWEICNDTTDLCELKDGRCATNEDCTVAGEICLSFTHTCGAAPEVVTDFKDLALESAEFWNGADKSGNFVSKAAKFGNNYNSEWHSWDGFAYSKVTDVTTPGYANQYSAITGKGMNSDIFAVGYSSGFNGDPTIKFDTTDGYGVDGIYLTNTTYAYLSMKNGDQYAKKFGGEDGDDKDWLLLTIKGIKSDGSETGSEVEFYLADYRFDDNSSDYIVKDWSFVDLSSLGEITALTFKITGSDVKNNYLNTPSFFAVGGIVREKLECGGCEAFQECNHMSGQCEGISCEDESDCDDGLVCNGAETCNAGKCQEGVAIACLADFVCIEEVEVAQPADRCRKIVADFDDLTLEEDSFWNGSDTSGMFVSGDAIFYNNYSTDYKSWEGFAYSNMKDTTTPGWGNQYSAITAAGHEKSPGIYGVAFKMMGDSTAIQVDKDGAAAEISGMYVTNTTFAYLSMKNGDDYAKKFGGEAGTDPDFFKLIVTGVNSEGNEVGKVEFYLADFRSDNPEEDYIVKDWKWMDLSSLGSVIALYFSFESSDVGDYGMNTPAYAAIDLIVR